MYEYIHYSGYIAGIAIVLFVLYGCACYTGVRYKGGAPACARCGYDLSGAPTTTERCTECGVELLRGGVIEAPHSRRARFFTGLNRFCSRGKLVRIGPVLVGLNALVHMAFNPPVGMLQMSFGRSDFEWFTAWHNVPKVRAEIEEITKWRGPTDEYVSRAIVVYRPGQRDSALDVTDPVTLQDALPAWVDATFPGLDSVQRSRTIDMIREGVKEPLGLYYDYPHAQFRTDNLDAIISGYDRRAQRIITNGRWFALEHTTASDLARAGIPVGLTVVSALIFFATRRWVRSATRRDARAWLAERADPEPSPHP